LQFFQLSLGGSDIGPHGPRVVVGVLELLSLGVEGCEDGVGGGFGLMGFHFGHNENLD